MLNELVRKAELGKAGLVAPFASQRKRPLAEHVADFRQHLEAKGNSGQHVALTVARCEAVFSACSFKLLGQLDADKASNWLKQRRAEGLGIATSNHHLVAVKGFGNWLVKSRRMERNPFAHLSRLNGKVDVRVERRALESEELSRLIEATELSKKTFRGLAGPDRAALYTLATTTGLRANELASLTLSSFDFQADPPTVTVEAKNEKSGRGATLPLHPFAADKVATWLKSRPPTSATLSIKPQSEPLWPGTWFNSAAERFRRDLAEARDAWLKEVPPKSPEHERRDASDFLTPENTNGETADFHALRHTFISMLASSGVHPKVAQQLARHSTITLTRDRSSHARLVDLNTAVENLLSLALPKHLMPDVAMDMLSSADSVAVQDNPSVWVARRVAVFGDVPCENGGKADETRPATQLAKEVENPLKTRSFQGISSKGSGRSRTDDDGFAIGPRGYAIRPRSTNWPCFCRLWPVVMVASRVRFSSRGHDSYTTVTWKRLPLFVAHTRRDFRVRGQAAMAVRRIVLTMLRPHRAASDIRGHSLIPWLAF